MVNSPMKTFYPIFFLAFRRILHWCPWACKKVASNAVNIFFSKMPPFVFWMSLKIRRIPGINPQEFFFVLDPNFADTKINHPIGKVRVFFFNIKDLVDKFGDMVDKIDGMRPEHLYIYIYI